MNRNKVRSNTNRKMDLKENDSRTCGRHGRIDGNNSVFTRNQIRKYQKMRPCT